MSVPGAGDTPAALKKRERSAALDAVRVLGVAAVIVGHAVPDDEFRRYLFAWHVPLFFFLSGYLWRDTRAFADEVRARTRTLAYPYLFWLAVVGLVYVPLTLSGYFSPAPSLDDWTGPLLGGANAREPFTTFWFVSALFFVALLFRLVMLLPAWARWAVGAAGLLAGYLLGSTLAHTPLAIGSALPCLIFLLVGRLIRPWVERMPRKALIGVALVVVGEVLVGTHLVQPVDIKLGRFGTPVAAVLVACVIATGLVLVAESVYRRASERAAAVTTALSYAGLTAVLLHPLFQWLLRPFDAPLWVFVVVMLVVPLAIGIGMRRTPLAQVATGAPRAGRAR